MSLNFFLLLNATAGKEDTPERDPEDDVVVMKPQSFLPDCLEGIVMTFSLCAEGKLQS